MKNDYENIEVGQKLKSRTIRAADVALHKKRFRFITASSLAAVVCAVVAVFLVLGGEPVPDVVIGSPETTGQGTVPSQSGEINEQDAINQARLRHIKVYPLSMIEPSGELDIDISLDETPIYLAMLGSESISENLAKYGFSAGLPDGQTDESYMYYLIAFKTPCSPLRYVSPGSEISGNELIFKYTCLDLGPFTVEDYYPGPGPFLEAESKSGFLVALPSSMLDLDFSAQYVAWEELPDMVKPQVVMDTILEHENLPQIIENGVGVSLAFELAVLRDNLDISIEYLKSYNYTAESNMRVAESVISSIVSGMLSNLLNYYQIKSCDMGIPEEAIKAALLSRAISDESISGDHIIIPEIHIFDTGITTYEDESISISAYGYTGLYAFIPPYSPQVRYMAFYTELDEASGIGFVVNKLEIAESSQEVNKVMGEFADNVINIDSTSIKSEMLSLAQEEYKYLADELSETGTAQSFTEDFQAIKQYMISGYGEINNPYSAIGRDLITHILDASEGDDVLQITAMTALSEDFDNPITVAVLAASYDGSETESEYARLYVVTAEYDETTWELINFDALEKKSLTMSEYPKLKYRGGRAVYYSLYTNLLARVRDIGNEVGLDLPEPIIEKNILADELNLGFASGSPQFVSVSRLIYPEEDAGVTSYIWYVEENPVWLYDDTRLNAIKNAEWEEITDLSEKSIAGYSLSAPGLVGIEFDVHVEDETSLYRAHFTIDANTRATTLWLSDFIGGSWYYRSYDAAIYNVVVDIFGIETDVSDYMITKGKGPTLPVYREELGYLIPIVGDMPGGIVSIETIVSSGVSSSGGLEISVIDDENEVIDWAQAVGEVLDGCTLTEMLGRTMMEGPDIVWNVNIAPQEGVGHIQISGYKDTGTIYIKRVYRLYGDVNAHEKLFIVENPELFDTLCELSFGKTLRE